MFKRLKSQSGLTLIELLVVIAIMVIISVVYYTNIQADKKDEVEQVTEQLLIDLRIIRNMATSRATFDMGGASPVYPPGGYGIYINRSGERIKYRLYADSGDNTGYDSLEDKLIADEVVFADASFDLLDSFNKKRIYLYFNFISENEISTDMTINNSRYVMVVEDPGPGYPAKGYRGVITVGEKTQDGSVLSNLGKLYVEFTPPDPGEDDGKDGGEIDPIWQ